MITEERRESWDCCQVNISTRFTADGIGTQPVVVSFAGAETTIWEMGDGPGLSVGSSGAILELPRRVG